MENENDCLTFEKYSFQKGFIDETIDATYIIHLKDNGRIDNIKDQINKYKTTKVVYIVYNKGFKNCKKPDHVQSSANDLFDVIINIFKHSNKMNYENILVLEDDYIFSEKIEDKFHQTNINSFLITNRDKPFIYLLGCVPFILFPYDKYNYRGLLASTTHSVIYNSKMRDIILSKNPADVKNHDDYFMMHLYSYKYVYYTPLCYQLFPETENQASWGEGMGPLKIIPYIIIQIFKLLKMDIQPEPGFSIFYFVSKISVLIFALLLIFVVLKTHKFKKIKVRK
jgi:hypothetical protein